MGGVVSSSLFRRAPGNSNDIDDELVLSDATSLSILEKSLTLLRSPFILNPTLSDNALRVAKEVWSMIQKDEVLKYQEARQGSIHSMSCLEWFVKKLSARVSELDSTAWDFFPEVLSEQVALVSKMVDNTFTVLTKSRIDQGETGSGAGWGCGCSGRGSAASVTPVMGGKYPPAGPAPTATRRKGDPLPPLYQFAKLHFHCGIETNHYVVVGLAMLSALKFCLGDELTENRHHAWAVVYSTVLMSMLPYSMALEVRYSFKGAGSGSASSVESSTLSLSASASASVSGCGVHTRPGRSQSDPVSGRLVTLSSSESANVYLTAEKLDNLRCLNENSAHSAHSRSQRSMHSSFSTHGEAGNPVGLMMMAKMASGGDAAGLDGISGGDEWSYSSHPRPSGNHSPRLQGRAASKDGEAAPLSRSQSGQGSGGGPKPTSSGGLSASKSQLRASASAAMQQMVLAEIVAEAAAIDAAAAGEIDPISESDNCAVTSYFMNLDPSGRSTVGANYQDMGDMAGEEADYPSVSNSLMM